MNLGKRYLLIGGAVLISAGLLFFAVKSAGEQNYVSEDLGVSAKVRSILNQIDTDGDGLKDWEESLWGTSPANPDTDRDGTTDGEEVAQNRDPLTPGPDDFLENKKSEVFISNENLTPTDEFAREFLTLYLEKKGDGEVSQEDRGEIINRLISEAPEATFKTYSAGNISVSLDGSESALKTYGNAVGKLFKESSLPANAYEPLQILAQSLQAEDLKGLNKLKAWGEDAEKVLGNLLVLKVPQTLAGTHLKLINGVSSLSADFKVMANAFGDPLSAIVHTRAYFDSVKMIEESVKEIASYFQKNNITFQQGEDGSLIMDTL